MKISVLKILVSPDETVVNVLKKLNETGERCLIVINKNKKFLGTITDGDIRKSILKKKDT